MLMVRRALLHVFSSSKACLNDQWTMEIFGTQKKEHSFDFEIVPKETVHPKTVTNLQVCLGYFFSLVYLSTCGSLRKHSGFQKPTFLQFSKHTEQICSQACMKKLGSNLHQSVVIIFLFHVCSIEQLDSGNWKVHGATLSWHLLIGDFCRNCLRCWLSCYHN